jgi:Type ISP C-terminal specificity domain/N-6 DNA Methylase
MYLIYPSSEESGRVAFILPQEGGLKQRDIRIFELGSRELATRLERFKIVPVAQNILCSVPLVERVFYDPIETSKDLAKALAKVAKAIEQIIPQVYRQEQKEGYLHKLLKSFQDELLPFLKLEAENDKDYSFADIYAQTVAYSLFTARVFSHLKWQKDLQIDPTIKEPLFDRESAWEQLPETNPFLRQLFKDISKQKAEELGDGLITEIANIFGILRAAKMEAILSDFSQTGNRDDIIIHFYEPFLAAYNPKLKKNRGVYYTPESVVSYMVRSVDILLKEKFHKPLGLADPDVMILDPATGTGTFLLWIFQLVERRFKGNDGDVESYRLIKEQFGDMSTSSPFIDKGGGYIVDAGYPKYEGACTERSRSGKVIINKQKDGFMDVPEAVWNFHVGGYQVCQKWLKDRKGRTLSQDDIRHYQKIVVALEQSIDLMAKIDAAIPN